MNWNPLAAALRARLEFDVPQPCVLERIDTQGRRIPLSYSHHVRGWHPVRSGFAPVPFESLLESAFIAWFANRPELTSLATQSHTFHYRFGRSRCRYTPDLLVGLSHVPTPLRALGFGLLTVIEVKPFERAFAMETALRHKLHIARETLHCPAVLLTELDLDVLEREVRHVA